MSMKCFSDFLRLNDFLAQCVYQYIKKYKFVQVIFEGLNNEYQGHAETMYLRALGGLFSKNEDEIWDPT